MRHLLRSAGTTVIGRINQLVFWVTRGRARLVDFYGGPGPTSQMVWAWREKNDPPAEAFSGIRTP